MTRALMVVSGTLVVLLCVDNPANIPWVLGGLATGVVLARVVNANKIKIKRK